jgi:hypothetical protein
LSYPAAKRLALYIRNFGSMWLLMEDLDVSPAATPWPFPWHFQKFSHEQLERSMNLGQTEHKSTSLQHTFATAETRMLPLLFAVPARFHFEALEIRFVFKANLRFYNFPSVGAELSLLSTIFGDVSAVDLLHRFDRPIFHVFFFVDTLR